MKGLFYPSSSLLIPWTLSPKSWTIDTACSGGLIGVDVACQYLRAGKISGAVVAAVNLWLSPEHTQELGSMRAAYSPTGRCHTFDAKADGYCRAEAANAVYLKRLSEAIRDGDPIRAVIRGTANNSDGWTPGINSPSAEAQAAVIRAAYADAGIAASQYSTTGYLECHGTGTPTGDPLEVKGAASVLASMRPPSEPLIIGSIKSNIGHSEPAAGLSGLIKAVLAVESGRIPGNPTFVSPNPEIDFEGLGVRASRPSMLWPSVSNSYRRASVNAFGYGGSNAHVVLDNTQHFIDQGGVPLEKIWQPHASSYVDPAQMLSMLVGSSSGTRGRPSKGLLPKQRRPQLLVFSANDQDSLKRQIDALSAHLLDPRVKVKLTDLSYTFSQRRSRHYHRAFLLAYPTKTGHVNNIAPELSKFANTPAAQAAIRIGLVFTGQGAQWSQMGAGLVAMFPQTAQLLQDLDHVLQQLPEDLRPKWSLLKELTEPRSPEHLGNPEYSQALVTALQLAQLSVLASWNVQADVIVGHSSGEIAAACCAGFLSTRQAILVAYLRGFAAASKQTTSSQSKMGMMAVGLSAKDVQPYLDAIPGEGQEGVVIACYNSPASITLSGPSEILMILVETIKADGHFARILQVEVAYHSRYMSEAAIYYQTLLENHGGLDDDNDDEFAFQSSFETFKPTMISSVTEQPLTQTEARSPAYWKENMLSPVRFEGACRSIIANNNSSSNNNKTLASTDLFIELGPSNSLAGPVAQTAKEVGGNPITYTSAAKRGGQGGNSSIQALFDVAGQLFLHNAQVSLTRVNVDETVEEEQAGGTPAAVIIDLPNYKWNHSTPYWHESLASKDWRFKQFTEHDLLGSKILGTLWQSPSWHKLVRLEDLPWLRDHQIGSEILFPAAGYVAMAMEAIRQTALSMATEEKELAQLKARKYHYSLRDVQFPRGLVLEDDSDVDLMLLLSPAGVKDSESLGWWQFRIMSLPASSAEASLPPSPDKWNQNSDGMIRLEYDDEDDEEEEEAACSLPLTYPSPAKAWYKSMARVGYSYGPAFQKKLVVECMEGQSRARALISLEPPRSKWEPQSEYPLHPASLDGCIQSVFISLHRGRPSSFDKLLLPRSIGEMTVSGRRSWQSGEAVSVVFSNNDASSNASVYDPEGGHSIVKFRDVLFSPMDVRESIYTAHTYARLSWKPDFSHLDTDEKLSQALSAERPHSGGDGGESPLHELLDLAAHKTPNLSVFEFNLIPGHTQALWLDQDSSIPRPVRAATSVFHFASNDANTVLATEERYTHSLSSAGKNARFSLCDPFSGAFTPPPSTEGTEFDLVVVRWSPEYSAGAEFNILATSIRRLLVGGGSVIFYDDSRQPDTLSRDDDDGDDASTGVDEFYRALEGAQFGKIRKTKGASCVVAEAAVAEKLIARGDNLASEQDVFVVHFLSERSVVVSDLLSQLRVIGWNVIELTIESNFLDHLPANSTVLVLDEVFQPILATATEEQWNALQGVIRKECDVVWVTEGSQIEPTSPIKAICHGVFRTVRAEAAISRIVTLDIETSTASRSAVNAATIDTALRQVKSKPASSTAAENEFAERTGLLYVSRIWPDEEVNQAKMEDANYTSTKAAVGPGDVEVEIRGTAHSNVQPTKRRLASSLLDPGHSYLFVGGLKGVCGSLALHLAAQGAKNIAVMSRSGCEDDASQRVAHNIRVLGCSVQIVRGDVTLIEDVRRCFDEISTPIGGIIQGAAIFRVSLRKTGDTTNLTGSG